MNNSNEIKSINLLIQNMISKFELNDFITSEINKNKICSKFNDLLLENQIFWTISTKPQDFPEHWCLIDIKSPHPNYETISVCFSFEKKNIKICVCNDITILKYVDHDPENEHIFEYSIIEYRKFMTNHQILADHLCVILNRVIQYAHRENMEERYPGK